jgi:hypothetical protein
MDRSEAIVAWDDEDDPRGNVQHIAEHDLTVAEVESVLLDPRNPETASRSSGRPIVFGWTDTDRFIAVIYEWVSRNPPAIYPVTAYETEP